MHIFWIVLLVLLSLVLVACAAVAVIAVRRSKALGPTPESRLSLVPVSEAISGHAAESLSHVIHFQTVTQSPGEAPNDEFLRFRRYLELRYPQVHQTLTREVLPGGSLLYCWKSPQPVAGPVLLCAHQDVVPADPADWSHPPFEGEIQDGWVYGRGALDCKGTLIALMESLETLCGVEFQPGRDLWIALDADEETGGSGAEQMAALLRDKGLRFDLVLDEGSAVRENYLDLAVPVALVGVAEKGMMNLRLTAGGQPGHASAPDRETPAGRLAEAICRLEQKRVPAKLHPAADRFLRQTAALQPKWDRLLIAGLPYTAPLLKWWMGRDPRKNALIRTTFATTMLSGGTAHNVIPKEVSAVVNCRLAHGNTGDEMLTYVRELLRDIQVTADELLRKEPGEISEVDCDAYALLTQTIHDVFGPVPVVPVELAMSTDGAHYEKISSHVYRFLPVLLDDGEQGRMHAPDERISVEAMGRAVMFYTALIQNLN